MADWQDAEELARWHMEIVLAFGTARRTAAGADRGLDVVAQDAVAQVKHHARPTGSPAIRDARGAAHDRQVVLFYSLNGYSHEAIRFASAAQVALFRYDIYGRVRPVGAQAKATLDSAHHRNEALEAVYQRKQERLRTKDAAKQERLRAKQERLRAKQERLRTKAAGWRRELAERRYLWAQEDLLWEVQASVMEGLAPNLLPEHLELLRERLQVLTERVVQLHKELTCLPGGAGGGLTGEGKSPGRGPKYLEEVPRSANHLNLLIRDLEKLGKWGSILHVELRKWVVQISEATTVASRVCDEATNEIPDEVLRRMWQEVKRESGVTADMQREYRDVVAQLQIV